MVGRDKANQGPSSERNGNNASTLVLAATLAWAAFVIIHGLAGHPLLSIVCALTAVGNGAVFLWLRRSTHHWHVAVHISAALASLALVAIALLSGQSSSVAWFYLALVPVFVGQLLGWSAVIAWGIIAALLSVGVVWSDVFVQFPVERIEGDAERAVAGFAVAAFAMITVVRSNLQTKRALLRATEQQARLAEKTRELEQRRQELAQAHEAADRSSRFKTAFLADMSHELRTPLNGVLGMATLLAECDLRPDHREMVDAIRTTGATLKHILDEILDISKTEEGRLELKQSPFRLRDCVVDAVDVFAGVAARKNIELVVLMKPAVPSMVVGDAARLGQVVRNLVGNAVKFTEKGEVVVSLAPSHDASEAILEVRDTGPGIDPDMQERLFQRYQSKEMPFGTSHVGTGLGLWLCRKLLDLMGGSIQVQSEPGKGTTFRATFPIVLWEDTNDTKRSSLALANARILAVESQPSAQQALRLFAMEIGADLTVVEDPDAALTLPSAPWDVAIVSAATLGDRLADFVPALRGSTGLSRLPVVLLTNPASVAKGHDQSVLGRFSAMTYKPVVATRLGPIIEHTMFMGYSLPAPSPAAAVQEPPEHRIRALVVEDDGVSRRVAELALGRLGCEVDTADGGEAGLAALRRQRYEVAFLDLVMPGVTGLEVAETIRKELPIEQLPFLIALTGSVFEADRVRARVAGMDDFLPKPLEVSALHEVLQRARMWVARRTDGPRRKTAGQHRVSGKPYDSGKLQELRELFGDDVSGLLQDFVEATEKDAALVREQMDTGDWEGIRKVAHTTKSRAAAMGAFRLSNAAKDLEVAALESNAAQLARRMLNEMEAVRSASQVSQ